MSDTLGFDTSRLQRIQNWMEGWVDDGKLPFAATVVARHGEIAWRGHTGCRDVASASPYAPDTIVRIYSMTKPVTSVALMMLYERGLFHLDDPIAEYLPEFGDVKVLVKGAGSLEHTEDLKTPPTIHHLFTHTSGLTYGFQGGLLGDAYTEAKADFYPGGNGLAEATRYIASFPLQFQPGEEWNYSVATDVLGRLIEVLSGRPLDEFFRDEIFEPLGMTDTAFSLPLEKLDRFASCYIYDEAEPLKLAEAATDSAYLEGKVKTFSGGGGLLSTADDYLKFAEMLRMGGKGPAGNLISPRTLKFMTGNHLEGDLASLGPETWCETSFHGVGFGLGFSVMLDPIKSQMLGSVGDYGWGGMASTVFWVDPQEDLSVVFLTQLIPSSTYPLRKALRTLVYHAMTD